MGEQEAPGKTEEAETATGAVDSPWPGRRSLGPPHLHLRRHHGWTIEETFKDVKEVWGAGQQQVRNRQASVGCFNLNGWMYSLVEAWSWEQPEEVLVDRQASPWDEEYRRPSHADRRKALQRQLLREEIQTVLAGRPTKEEIRNLAERLLELAA
jgi:hypothetical protein